MEKASTRQSELNDSKIYTAYTALTSLCSCVFYYFIILLPFRPWTIQAVATSESQEPDGYASKCGYYVALVGAQIAGYMDTAWTIARRMGKVSMDNATHVD